jgi:NitT/TauT family transport system substrate-binding protein
MLRNRTIAVNFHAGSHFLTLQLLEGFMAREEIKVVHMGQARLRYQSMMDGVVDAAMLMEPFIALAEKTDCNLIMEGHYAGSEMMSPELDAETAAVVDRVIRKAVGLINADKKKYLRHIIADLPPELRILGCVDISYLLNWRYETSRTTQRPVEENSPFFTLLP